MKDTWILVLAGAVVLLISLGSQFLRGDFTRESKVYSSISSDGQCVAVEKDGLALININAADAETLMRADGIGETLSRRIVLYREENGPFSSMEELLEVDGIGEATLEKISPQITCIPN